MYKEVLKLLKQSKNYFRPELNDLHDPWLMKDMDKAVERIIRAVNNNEKILVFGDYDVDGTTSVACMYQFLEKNSFRILIFIFLIVTAKVME